MFKGNRDDNNPRALWGTFLAAIILGPALAYALTVGLGMVK